MAVTLSYGAYTFPISPQVTIQRSTKFDTENIRTATIETWNISGFLRASGGIANAALLDALTAAFSTDLKLLVLKDGATVIASMDPATIYRGPVVKDVDAPSEGGEAAWATNMPFSIIVEGERQVGGKAGDPDVVEDDQEISFSTDQDRITRKTIRGRIVVVPGVDVKSKVLPRDPGFSVPPGETAKAFIRTLFEINNVSSDLTECEYVFEWTELFEALPSGVTSGSFSTTMFEDAEGTLIKTIAGTWVGDKSEEAALALEPPGPLREREIRPNGQENSTSFRFVTEENTGSFPDVIRFEETITFAASYTRKVFWERRSAGLGPYRQDVGLTPAVITQAGRAVGRTSFPVPPALVFPADDLNEAPVTEFKGPKRGIDGIPTEYEVRWRFVFAFSTDPAVPTPATEPLA